MVNKTASMVDTFIIVLNSQSNSARYSEAELISLSSTFSGIRSNLLQTTASLNAALATLNSAEDGVDQANVAASGATVSVSDAQVKQALGALRAAEANLAKTILRSPIYGTINSLSVQPGDYISGLTNVAVVANNAALEIVAFAGDRELEQLSVGETVLIEGSYEGVITQIAPAVNQQTKKTEIRIGTENTAIKNGQTVVISAKKASSTAAETIQVPITAVKFEVVDGFVFLVNNGKLEKRPVTIGVINGNSVEITAGLTATE